LVVSYTHMEPLQQNPNPEPVVSQNSAGLPVENPNTVPQMRTFSTDLAEELRKHQGSAMKIAVMENEKRFREEQQALNDPKKNFSFLLSGVVIVLVAIGITLGIYFYNKKTTVVPVVQTNVAPVSIIHSEDLSTINVTGKSASDIGQAVSDAVKNSTTQTGMIDNVYITQGPQGSETRLTASMFLSAIGAHITTDFSHALLQEYMVGIYSYSGANLFIVLQGTQHDSMLAGMLQWEPYFLTDLAPMFGIDTTGDNAYLLNNPVTETLIENHDTRAVLDKNNKPVLFYSFLDDNTVLITHDSKTLIEAVRRISN